MKKLLYSAIILLGVLAVFGWQQANSLSQEIALLRNRPPIETVVYRFPNTPPYTEFPDPIDFDQALLLLNGMRASHEEVLNVTFNGSPGFGIDDRDFQLQVIKWYDQLIDFVWRQEKQ